MASLKEVKTRINSVKSTRKITSAMKMVASAKLHKAQGAIENMLPYQKKLNKILTNFLSADLPIESPYVQEREVKRVKQLNKKYVIVAYKCNHGTVRRKDGDLLRSTVRQPFNNVVCRNALIISFQRVNVMYSCV